MLKINKRMAFVAVGAVVAIGSGSAAYAYWTTPGTGSGTASSTAGSTVTVSQNATGTLTPGATVALTGTFTNADTTAAVVNTLTGVVSVTPSSAIYDASKPSCTTADYTLSGGLPSAVTVPPTASASWSGLSLTMANTGANQDNCKNAVVTVTYTTA